MEGIEELLNKLESIEQRLNKLENGEREVVKKKEIEHNCTISPSEMVEDRFAYVGKYQSKDRSFGSTFGADYNRISALFEGSSFEMAKVIDAFSSEERLDIIKILMQQRMSAKQLMDKLDYPTTGKLYHHLSFLDKIGVITKENDQYFVTPRFISSVVLILTGAEKIGRNNETY